MQRFPVRATASHRPYLRFLIAPHTPDALRCISWLIRVIAIKLLLLEVPSVVSGMRLGTKLGFGQWGTHKERGGVLGCPRSTKASMPPEWLIGKQPMKQNVVWEMGLRALAPLSIRK